MNRGQIKSDCCGEAVIENPNKKSDYVYACTKCKKDCGVVRLKGDKDTMFTRDAV